MTAMVLLSEWVKSQVEFWKPIEGFKGYDVSSNGRVRSWWRRGGSNRGYVIGSAATILRFSEHRQGYLEAALYRKEQRRAVKKVHRLVAEAFLDNPNGLPQVNHITGLKGDCRVYGLEWTTQSGNQRHAVANGLRQPPCGIGKVLSAGEQQLLYDRVLDGVPRAVLAREFGISRPTVKQVFLREQKLRRISHATRRATL